MSKVSFSRPGASAPVANTPTVIDAQVVGPGGVVVDTQTTVPAQTGVAVREPASYPVPSRPAPRYNDDDDIPFEDIRLPGINVAQAVGDLGTQFPLGSVILGKQLVIAGAPPRATSEANTQVPLQMVFLGFRAVRWSEQIPGGGLGRLFGTEQEVYGMGGTTQYGEKEVKPYFRKLVTALLLVKRPADVTDDVLFPFVTVEGEGDAAKETRWGVATWNLQGSSHTNVVVPIKSARKTRVFRDPTENDPNAPNGRYLNRLVQVTTQFQKFQNGNAAYVPVVKIVGFTSKEVREVAREFLG